MVVFWFFSQYTIFFGFIKSNTYSTQFYLKTISKLTSRLEFDVIGEGGGVIKRGLFKIIGSEGRGEERGFNMGALYRGGLI